MSLGTWFAFCSPDRRMSFDDLAAYLGKIKGHEARVENGQLYVDIDEKAEIIVSFAHDADVLAEAVELAEDSDRPDRDTLAKYGARYELTWESEDSHAVYNTAVTIAGKLEKECGAIVYDTNNARYF